MTDPSFKLIIIIKHVPKSTFQIDFWSFFVRLSKKFNLLRNIFIVDTAFDPFLE